MALAPIPALLPLRSSKDDDLLIIVGRGTSSDDEESCIGLFFASFGGTGGPSELPGGGSLFFVELSSCVESVGMFKGEAYRDPSSLMRDLSKSPPAPIRDGTIEGSRMTPMEGMSGIVSNVVGPWLLNKVGSR